MKDMCATCRRPKSEHVSYAFSGVLECPPRTTYFNPCRHERRQGSACLSSDGKGWSDTVCIDCGERYVIGKPPYLETP